MRLRRLDLTRYGKFTDYSIDFGPHEPGTPDLHIIYGLNEAGKSTSLSGFLDLLFGIEERTRYGFLHQNKAMELGGCLEFDGKSHELKRLKQRTNSLINAQNQPVNEALLSVPLAGLNRDAYRTMFSLDDETLESGGNAILESKGDLGELLFSASAGLAGISAALEKTAQEADAIFRKRASTTDIAVLKRRIADLKTRRDEIDVQASTFTALVAALKQAEAAYDEAMRDKGAARARHEDIARLLRAVPLGAEHARLTEALADFRDLPQPPAHWSAELPSLMKEEATLQTRLNGLDTRADLARQELEDLAVDEQLLALADQLNQLADAAARYSTAEEDLPKRRKELADRDLQITLITRTLGAAVDTDPQTLLVPAATIGILRELIASRSGIDVALETATREQEAAKAALEDARQFPDEEATARTPFSPSLAAQLQAALARLRQSDLLAQLRLAERNLPAAQASFNTALALLSPWSGHGQSLRALDLPDGSQIEGWRTKLSTLEKRQTDHADKIRDLTTRRADHLTRIEVIRSATGAITDEDLAASLTQREEAWQDHLGALDQASAASFEKHMRGVDQFAQKRLEHAADLADLRSHTAEIAVADTALSRNSDLLNEAERALEALRNEVGAAVSWLDLPPKQPLAAWLSQLERWSKNRIDALSAFDDLQDVEAALSAAKSEIKQEETNLRALLASAIDTDDLPLPALIQLAETTLADNAAEQTRRASAGKRMKELEAELALRNKGLDKARLAAESWNEHWQSALQATWFADRRESPGAVREILDALTDLPATLKSRADIHHRIAAMEADRTAFARRVAAIGEALDETLDAGSPLKTARQLAQRFEEAKTLLARHREKQRDLNRLEDERAALNEDLALHRARKSELTAFFEVETLQDVSTALDQSAERSRRLDQQRKLESQILAELQATTLDAALDTLADLDLAELQREQAELTARLDDLDERGKILFAEKTRASDRLSAVGGDDAVARIESERRTVLLQIEDLALHFLRLRTGGLLADHAIRAYRDKHRSAMMNRASEAFRIMTRDEYSGLATRPEKSGEVLIGLSRNGGSKLATDMSKGTRFQLYLALRLAGYEEFASARPAVPFVADDIMETFDEPRSEEVFRLFGEMAAKGQVIYLTHHRHLCDIAAEMVPSVRVHELG
ncbi:AAA family ATPase [Tianweitania sp. BSSL-BM11]|uniref:AAA family ATPase n=1 Tax=Tianweitania aestuarii TaxID=2814886 RepID=A0ABS5RYL3_9HYPH|nr:AAA family ATPase [Tianweitania aestuarii]MBS9722133.1 AAA family ATPase [Tianweitania aestuarii]